MQNNIFNTSENIDNGGANAKKGFNYQDAVATLIIISNYSKNDFCIFLECRDDIEVDIDSHKFFIQVKSAKQSINSLIKTTKKKDGTVVKSVLYKNLNKTDAKSTRYKIVTTNFQAAKSNMEGLIFKELYKYSEDEKNVIIEKLHEQGLTKTEIEEKINNSYIHVSPFDDNLEHACTYLKGLMVENGISTENERGHILLNEILHDIHLKSEKKIITESDMEKKKIKKEDLKKLLKVETCFKYMEEVVDKLEKDEIINFAEKIKINNCIRTVDLKHKAEYRQVDTYIKIIDKTGKAKKRIKEAFDSITKKVDIEPTLLYAILIDKYVMEAINS